MRNTCFHSGSYLSITRGLRYKIIKMTYSIGRRIVQLSVVALIVFLTFFYLPLPAAVDWLCPFWHLQTIAGWNVNPLYFGIAWRPYGINFIWVLAALFVSVLIFGRVFCGWICPFGFLLEMVGKVSVFFRKKRKEETRAFQKASLFLPKGKYLTLLMFLILAYFWKEALFCYICPAGGIFRAMIGFFSPLSLIVLTAVLLSVLLWGMKAWCRYLCPLGGALSFFSFKQLFRIRKEGKCLSCKECSKVCPVEINLEKEFQGNELVTPDCLMCLRCLEVCSKKILKFP